MPLCGIKREYDGDRRSDEVLGDRARRSGLADEDDERISNALEEITYKPRTPISRAAM